MRGHRTLGSRPRRRGARPPRRLVLAGAVLALAAAPAVAAFTLDGVSANIPGNPQPSGQPSIALGSLAGHGNPRVPWIAQVEPPAGGGAEQIFVDKFAAGRFSLQGDSLNLNPSASASHPDIDFAGAAFNTPWTDWEEPVGGVDQILASRFLPNADRSNGVWEINGAIRGAHGPSLNFNPDRSAADPRIAGGTLNVANPPVPWAVWTEDASVGGIGDQIFVTKGVKDSAPGAAQKGSFTWHIQGTDRGGAGLGPTLNVQIGATIDGEHPDITFTGPGNTVPWAVWYEESNNLAPGATPAAPNNQRVFAAKFVPDATLGDRGGRWVPVGNSAMCAFATGSEDPNACELNDVATANAENPNVAAGSLDPAKATVPWVAWHESTGSAPGQIFVSRLVPAENRFVIFPGPNADGSLNANPADEADEPDLHFEGDVLHVTWKESVSGKTHVFARRFTPGAGGAGGSWSAAQDLQVDGSADAGNPAISSFGGSPFVTWAEGSASGGGEVAGLVRLKHDPAKPAVSTLTPSSLPGSSLVLNGVSTGDPGVYAAGFALSGTGLSRVVPADPAGDVTHNAPAAQQPFSASVSGLPGNTAVKVQAQLQTAFGTTAGAPAFFVTAGQGAPAALGKPPVPTGTTVGLLSRTRVHLHFRLSRKWKVTIVVHQGGRRGPVVGRQRRAFHKGRNATTLTLSRALAPGRVTVVITPRAGLTFVRHIRVR